jgi:hypothetical protein
MGRVYAIICYDTGEIYVGSTTRPMYSRIAQHRHFYDYDGPTAAKPIILREQYEFIILEECDDDVLLDMEQKHIDALSLCNIVNKKRARRTAEQKRQYTTEFSRKSRMTDKVIEKRKEKMECGCGSLFRKEDKSRHYKSQKHQRWAKTQQNI